MSQASRAWSALALTVLCAAAAGNTIAAEESCLGLDHEERPALRMAQVVATAPRTHFLKNPGEVAGCPATTAACQRGAYLVPGDVVLSDHTEGGYLCATYVAKSGKITTGWLPAAALKEKPVAAPVAADWAGEWHDVTGAADFRIRLLEAGRLEISGDASWGSHDPERVAIGAVNVGQIEPTVVTPAPAGFTFEADVGNVGSDAWDHVDAGCLVHLRRIGEWLVADDNNRCGGMNVSFTGIYRKL